MVLQQMQIHMVIFQNAAMQEDDIWHAIVDICY